MWTRRWSRASSRCANMSFLGSEREEERGGIMFSYTVRHMNTDNIVLQVLQKTDD